MRSSLKLNDCKFFGLYLSTHKDIVYPGLVSAYIWVIVQVTLFKLLAFVSCMCSTCVSRFLSALKQFKASKPKLDQTIRQFKRGRAAKEEKS